MVANVWYTLLAHLARPLRYTYTPVGNSLTETELSDSGAVECRTIFAPTPFPETSDKPNPILAKMPKDINRMS